MEPPPSDIRETYAPWTLPKNPTDRKGGAHIETGKRSARPEVIRRRLLLLRLRWVR